METDGRTIIISTPEELFTLITEAVRLADYGYENAQNNSDSSNQKLLTPKTVYPFGTSQPSQASGRTRAKRSQSAALLSSSVKTYARTSAKPVSPIKCPYTARPSRIAAKETPYPGRVISSPFPASERASSNCIYPPLRLVFPYAGNGPFSSRLPEYCPTARYIHSP